MGAPSTSRVTWPWVALGLTLLVLPAAAGDDVVVSVGTETVTLEELQQRVTRMPAAQLLSLGKDRGEILKALVERAIVPELLFAAEGKRQKLLDRPQVEHKVKSALQGALMRKLQQEVSEQQPITDADVAAYFQANKSRFQTPARIQLWRILVSDKSRAAAIIELAKGADGPKRWTDIARKESKDEATKMRSGNLGFVNPDGSTNVPRVKIEPALVDAASKVKDGELVPEPVKEGDDWAAVWRRGSLPGISRSLAQETASIRSTLVRERIKKARDSLLKKLRKEHVKDVHPELLKYVSVSQDGLVGTRQRPGVVPRGKQGGPAPRHEPGGGTLR